MKDSVRISHAITRSISDRFQEAVTLAPALEPINVSLARKQHSAYVAALRFLGLTVTELPPLAEHPDCCFVEDCAIYAEGVALITQLGAPSRQGEESTVADALAPFARIERMTAPATLDGGDCMRVGKRWYVGQSARTNAAGIAKVRAVFEPLGFEIDEVPLNNVLHLKCVCSPLGDNCILLAHGSLPRHTFRGVEVVEIPEDETYAANCVRVHDTVLVSRGFPNAATALKAAGFTVLPLEMSEIKKADGSLTCLSILL